MKLSSNAAVTRLTHEGITDFESLLDFDRDSIEALVKACSREIPEIVADEALGIAGEAAVNGANISSISIRRLVIAMHAVKYYTAIGRVPTPVNMHYANILSTFKTDYEAYGLLRKQDAPAPPKVNDKDREKKVIKWAPLFADTLSRTFGSKGPLLYIIREDANVPNEEADPLLPNCHFGTSGSLLEELVRRLPHNGPIYQDDNKTVFMMISTAVTGTSVESTIKSFSRTKDGRGAYQALISNHAGETKYRSIVKARMNLLQNIKWNGRSYSLEQHVSNHRSAVDDLKECAVHVQTAVPNTPQRVEYLLESITSQDSSLQAAMGNVRADTNNMRSDFEATSNHLIEVDPYKRSSRNNQANKPNANVSSVSFAGRGKTGVDLRWHSKQEFRDLPAPQKDELIEWQKSGEGKDAIKAQRKAERQSGGDKKRKSGNGDGGSWKKKFKKALKTPNGISHVMSVLRDAEVNSSGIISALQPAATLPSAPAPAPTPAPAPAPRNSDSSSSSVAALAAAFPALSTKVQINDILKSGKSSKN